MLTKAQRRSTALSGVLWSRLSLGNLSRKARPLTFLHNPLAKRPLAERWGAWDREFVTTRDGENWAATDILADERPADPAGAGRSIPPPIDFFYRMPRRGLSQKSW
jgi:hypothetical protein